MSSVFFKEAGNGPPLVFLHGFCDSHALWTEFVAPLTRSYRVFTLDLPGFGQSPLPPTPLTIDHAGDEIAAWMKEQGVQKPVVIGHSLGGYVALSMLARHSQSLRGLVLFHSTPFADSDERKKVRDKVIKFVGTYGVGPFIDTFVPGLFRDKSDPHIGPTRQRALRTKKEALIQYARAMRDRPDRSGTVLQCKIPVTVIAGTHDSLIPVKDLREFGKKCQKCTFHEVLGAAHMGIFEAKNECQTMISGYVESLESIK